MAPRPGFEPGTFSLTANCSTVELPRNIRKLYYNKCRIISINANTSTGILSQTHTQSHIIYSFDNFAILLNSVTSTSPTSFKEDKMNFDNSSKDVSAYSAAIGGAMLGVLLTLLILAMINEGTLHFVSEGNSTMEERLTYLELRVERINQNVGAL